MLEVLLKQESITTKREFDVSLEALRGLAALLVVIGHAVKVDSHLDPTYHIAGPWQYGAPAHLSVIVFFMLSGYVIGLSNPKPIHTRSERWLYVKKRLVRLYPLYLISLLATIGVAALQQQYFSLTTIGGWLLFLQGLAVDVPDFNQPIWSLGYEIFYYAAFILVSARQWRAEYLAVLFLIIGLFISKLHIGPVVLASYAYGAVFWFLGLFLNRFRKSSKPLRFGKMLAFLLLLLCFERMNLGFSILYALNLDIKEIDTPSFYDRAIVFSDMSYLVFCLPLLLCFTRRSIWRKQWIELVAFGIPALYMVAYIASGKVHQVELMNTIYIPVACYISSLIVYARNKQFNDLGERIIEKMKPLGLISYGIYIIHFPLLFLFQQVTAFSGSREAFAVRLLLYLAVVIGVGYVLEMKVQPWFKKRLM
ncbi:acyltransferase [Hymenobacter sediminis]|nr:acyltransferase [Hymenobacter sediminis]